MVILGRTYHIILILQYITSKNLPGSSYFCSHTFLLYYITSKNGRELLLGSGRTSHIFLYYITSNNRPRELRTEWMNNRKNNLYCFGEVMIISFTQVLLSHRSIVKDIPATKASLCCRSCELLAKKIDILLSFRNCK